MTAEIRWFWARLNANYWFYPALFAIGGGALAFLLVWLDRNGFAAFLNDMEWLTPARPEGASNMLTVIAGAMIAVASTVFSITIVAVSYASSTYGPRLLTNFMEDKGNQLSLATFIGTFVYAITVLRTIRAEDESAADAAEAAATALPGFVPQLSLLVAYLLMALSVAVLVFFLNHVPSGIRIANVLEGIGKRLIQGIEKTYPDEGSDDGPTTSPEGEPLHADRPGYVQLIEFTELARIGDEHDCDIALKVRTGDFVHDGIELAQLRGGKLDDDIRNKLREQFNLGPARTPEQDPQFLIDELVEIGLRALSPGINDPFTAITALHWLGAATAELGQRRLEKRVCEEDAETCRVFPVPDDFDHYVARGFGAIRSAAATNPLSTKVMLDVLAKAALAIGPGGRAKRLEREAHDLLDQARLSMGGPDLAEVEQAYTLRRAEMPA
ncbi:DUF2254 domain-containing protein [Alteraurantiacibacter aquimixticola]|uniref:DUF2254 domain-containing protein n=1 Tax=Alteraurantiacibacter aquimixticola TaxID=2489173 RepID=A0A4T3F4D8_9SPHN|nr:DUF2254 domain-containing protein [Alteraurantiacibacter aquimixticola]TIX51194.1 DUF2254 domain-containing protein [Alteraurantiacibacter aquimixticola]